MTMGLRVTEYSKCAVQFEVQGESSLPVAELLVCAAFHALFSFIFFFSRKLQWAVSVISAAFVAHSLLSQVVSGTEDPSARSPDSALLIQNQ